MNVWHVAVSFLIGLFCGLALMTSWATHMYHELQKGDRQKREALEADRDDRSKIVTERENEGL